MTVKIPFVVRIMPYGQKLLTFEYLILNGTVLGRHNFLFLNMDKEVKKMLVSFIPALLFVGVLWLIEYLEVYSGFSLTSYGVLPRTVEGLKGVIFSPFVHDDYKHLLSNSIPLIVLGAGLFYFYKDLAWRVIAGIYLLSGFWLWLGGRESYHIGASGLVYGLTAFLFLSGVLRRETRLMALSLLVVFLYGGMVWGLFPLFIGVSFEAHIFGTLAGFLFAFVYRKEGPQRKVYLWEDEEESEEDEENAYWKLPQQQNKTTPSNDTESNIKSVNIHYIYRTGEKKSPPPDEKN